MDKLIYLASPYTTDDANLKARRVRQVTDATAKLTNRGHIIFSPIIHSHPISEAHGLPGDWTFWERFDTVYLRKCDELWILMLPDWDKSKGIQGEIEIARKLGKTIRYIAYPDLYQTHFENNTPSPTEAKVLEFPKAQKALEVIGLNGFAQCGKDTLGKFLVENQGFTRISFADALRDALYVLNPIVSATQQRLQTLVDVVGWENAKNVYPEVRRLLQVLGTEVGREMIGQNVWIDIARRKAEQFDKVVFTDVRFPNEAEMIHALGGKVFQIIRPGVNAVNAHPSELPLSFDLIDCVFLNNGTIEDLHKQYERLEDAKIAA